MCYPGNNTYRKSSDSRAGECEGGPFCEGVSVGKNNESAGDCPIAKNDLCNAEDDRGASLAIIAAGWN